MGRHARAALSMEAPSTKATGVGRGCGGTRTHLRARHGADRNLPLLTLSVTFESTTTSSLFRFHQTRESAERDHTVHYPLPRDLAIAIDVRKYCTVVSTGLGLS